MLHYAGFYYSRRELFRFVVLLYQTYWHYSNQRRDIVLMLRKLVINN